MIPWKALCTREAIDIRQLEQSRISISQGSTRVILEAKYSKKQRPRAFPHAKRWTRLMRQRKGYRARQIDSAPIHFISIFCLPIAVTVDLIV